MINLSSLSSFFLSILLLFCTVNAKAANLDISNLPVKEFATNTSSNQFVILFTGDGGWKPLVKEMADFYQEKGIPVVGLDVQKYFWDKRSPSEIGKALEDLIDFYKKKWGKDEVGLIGYSMGAEVLPFAVNQLTEPADRSMINNIVLIAANQHVQFEITLLNYFGTPTEGAPLLPELKKLDRNKVHILCDDDAKAICGELPKEGWDTRQMEGGHHFGKDYDKVNQIVWNMTNGK